MFTLPSLFGSSLLLCAPVVVVLTFTLLLIASLQVTGAKPEQATRAIGSYILKTVGLLMVAASVMELMYALITTDLPEPDRLTGLLFLLVTGLGIMIHESRVVAGIDATSSSAVQLIFAHTCEIVGTLVALFSGLSIIMTFFFTKELTGWEMPTTLLVLGLLLMFSSSVHIHAKHHRAPKRMVVRKK